MDVWSYIGDRSSTIFYSTYQHGSAVIQATVLAGVIAIIIAVLVYRSDALTALAIGISSTILTIPSFALLGLLIPLMGLGVLPTMTALTLYGLLPIIRNTIVGLKNVDPAILEAAKGIGTSRFRILLRVELPLAWPSILAGIRVSVQLLMGIAALAAYVAGPGLGSYIFTGLSRLGGVNALNSVLVGTFFIAILAIIFDLLLRLLGRLTISRGIRA